MSNDRLDLIAEKTAKALVKASSSFREDQKKTYEKKLKNEQSKQAAWVLENLLENAKIAEKTGGPLCDDTGIPHVILEVGRNKSVSGEMIDAVKAGIAKGLHMLPGRPMSIMGSDIDRLEQTGGLDPNPGNFPLAPILILPTDRDVVELHILMQGGGPEIRSKTFRVFHWHSVDVLAKEITSWAKEEIGNLGCTPSTLALGIGRSHFEATSLMLKAMIKGRYDKQNDLEKKITESVNECDVGPIGLGGTTILATFIEVGPQRASGVRIVSLRPCCCVEPRVASVIIED